MWFVLVHYTEGWDLFGSKPFSSEEKALEFLNADVASRLPGGPSYEISKT